MKIGQYLAKIWTRVVQEMRCSVKFAISERAENDVRIADALSLSAVLELLVCRKRSRLKTGLYKEPCLTLLQQKLAVPDQHNIRRSSATGEKQRVSYHVFLSWLIIDRLIVIVQFTEHHRCTTILYTYKCKKTVFLQRVSIACYAERCSVLAMIDSVCPTDRPTVCHTLVSCQYDTS